MHSLTRRDKCARDGLRPDCVWRRVASGLPDNTRNSATILDGRAMTRTPEAVFGFTSISHPPILTIALVTNKCPVDKSKSRHLSAASSPRRNPVARARRITSPAKGLSDTCSSSFLISGSVRAFLSDFSFFGGFTLAIGDAEISPCSTAQEKKPQSI